MDSDGSASFAQHVTAVAGIAYGTQNADIHVFGDGSPLYLLTNWRAGPPADPRWRLSNLTWLFKNTLLHRPDVRTRIR